MGKAIDSGPHIPTQCKLLTVPKLNPAMMNCHINFPKKLFACRSSLRKERARGEAIK